MDEIEKYKPSNNPLVKSYLSEEGYEILLAYLNQDKSALHALLDQNIKKLKDPGEAWFRSWFFGIFAADRFYLGDTGAALLKLFTLGGGLAWCILDIFLIVGDTKRKNMKSLTDLLGCDASRLEELKNQRNKKIYSKNKSTEVAVAVIQGCLAIFLLIGFLGFNYGIADAFLADDPDVPGLLFIGFIILNIYLFWAVFLAASACSKFLFVRSQGDKLIQPDTIRLACIVSCVVYTLVLAAVYVWLVAPAGLDRQALPD